MEALCRRVGRSASAEAGEQAPASLVSGSFVLDENRRVLLKAGKPIELTQVEFQIMELFFRTPVWRWCASASSKVSGVKTTSAMLRSWT